MRCRAARLTFVSLCFTLLPSCGGDPSGPTEVASISVSPANSTTWVNGTVELTATAYNRLGGVIAGVSFDWTSTRTQHATVSDGLVTGYSEGYTLVIASAAGLADTAYVEVFAALHAGLCDGTADPTYTCHAPSSLEFLNLTEGYGMTYNDMVSELEPGRQFAGHRYATESEIRALMEDAEIQGVGSSSFSAANWTPVNALIDLVGQTRLCGPPTCGNQYRLGSGFTADMVSTTRQIAVLQADIDHSTAAAYFSNTTATATTYGHWLVRE